MSSSENYSLPEILSFDLEQFDQDYRSRRTHALRDRFLAGVLQSLRDHPVLGDIWIDLSAKSSVNWVRSHLDIYEHDQISRGPTTEENRVDRGFYKSLASTRSAISSTSTATVDSLQWCLPAWRNSQSHSREELTYVIEHLLSDPKMRLFESDLASLRSDFWDGRFPVAVADKPRPRI